jgi:RNA polymerase sigma-70 factor, ECF subfamily
METLAAEVLIRFQTGEREAFRLVIEHFRQKMFRLGLRLFSDPNDADDFAQDVFIRAYEKRGQYDPTRTFEPWLYRLAINLGRGTMRKRKIREVSMGDRLPEITVAPRAEQELIDSERSHRLQAVFNQLAPKYKVCLALRLESDLSLEEMAKTLKLPLSTVKTRLYRGLKTFAAALSAQKGDLPWIAEKVNV